MQISKTDGSSALRTWIVPQAHPVSFAEFTSACGIRPGVDKMAVVRHSIIRPGVLHRMRDETHAVADGYALVARNVRKQAPQDEIIPAVLCLDRDGLCRTSND